MLTNKIEAKTMVKNITCDCKCKFDSATCNSNKNGIMNHVNVSVKVIVRAKKTKFGIIVHVFVRMVSI